MKSLKRLVAVIVSVVMICALSTVAFAATLDAVNNTYEAYFVPATITQGTTTFTIQVGMKNANGEDVTIGTHATNQESMFYASLSEDAVNAGIKAIDIDSTIVTAVDKDFGDGEYFGCNFIFDKAETTTLNATTPIFTVTFTAPADLATGTYGIIKADKDNDYLTITDQQNSGESGAIGWENTTILTVTAPAAKTDTKVTADGDPVAKDITIEEKHYTNIWTCSYSVTEVGNKEITGAKLKFSDREKEIDDFSWIVEGTLNVRFAVIGAPLTEKATIELVQE